VLKITYEPGSVNVGFQKKMVPKSGFDILSLRLG
jgi:hypothetical protein